MQTGPGGKKQELFAKKPLKTTKKGYNKNFYRPRRRAVKSRIWRANSKVTPLDSVVSAHPQNISLSLPTDLKKLRSIGPFYLAIIELNPKQRMGVNKSDSYIGCRRKNVKRPFGTKNVCEEADRFRILVQFFSSLSIQENHTTAPAYQTVVQRFHDC